jgi:hypothetical protein
MIQSFADRDTERLSRDQPVRGMEAIERQRAQLLMLDAVVRWRICVCRLETASKHCRAIAGAAFDPHQSAVANLFPMARRRCV